MEAFKNPILTLQQTCTLEAIFTTALHEIMLMLPAGRAAALVQTKLQEARDWAARGLFEESMKEPK